VSGRTIHVGSGGATTGVSIRARSGERANHSSRSPQPIGSGVTPPAVISRVEPQYSDLARKGRIEGTVVLEAIVKKDGSVDILRVVRGLGFGLDENAVKALKQWRFRPGMKNGDPVDVSLNIEVTFNFRQ